MSPPIRDGSGSSIGSIRLGDGSEISEVRTGAGDVLFSAIPDSGLKHNYSPLNLADGSTVSSAWPDDEQSADLPVVGDPTYNTDEYNGRGAVALDNDDGFGEVTFASSIPQPFGIFTVINPTDTGNIEVIWHGAQNNVSIQYRFDSFDDIVVDTRGLGGSITTHGTPSSGLQLLSIEVDGPSTRLRIDGSDIATGLDGGSGDLTGYNWGRDPADSSKSLDGDVVQNMIYDMSNQSVTDVERFLNDLYKIY